MDGCEIMERYVEFLGHVEFQEEVVLGILVVKSPDPNFEIYPRTLMETKEHFAGASTENLKSSTIGLY